MNDIVERLRAGAANFGYPLFEEAADEIERLRKSAIETMQEMLRRANEIERLRLALQEIADMRYDNTSAATIARRALEPKP